MEVIQGAVLFWVFLYHLIGSSAAKLVCNTEHQDELSCIRFKSMAKLKFGSVLSPFASNIGSLFGGIPEEFTKTVISTFDECKFDPTSDKSIAGSFAFLVFKPDNDEPEHISGIELLNNCHALKSSSSSITKTIWLWPGWLSNCSKADAIDNDYKWTIEHAPALAKQAQAQIVAIDWGSSDLSCCSYPLLIFCHAKVISSWMAHVIKKCSAFGTATSMSNTWLIGHSLGAQFIGFTAKSLNKSGYRVKKVIGLDPCGPFFAKNGLNGKCHGIENGQADQTIIFYTNPHGLGTEPTDSADVRILCNRKNNFCQLGCDCKHLTCNHFYATNTLYAALVQGNHLQATCLTNQLNGTARISIYDEMSPGLYDLDSNQNPLLQTSIKKRSASKSLQSRRKYDNFLQIIKTIGHSKRELK